MRLERHYCPRGCALSIPVVVELTPRGWRIVACRSYNSLAGTLVREHELYESPVVRPRSPRAARTPARPGWADQLLAALRAGADITRACEQAGVSYRTLRRRREQDEEFAEAVRAAREEGRRCASR